MTLQELLVFLKKNTQVLSGFTSALVLSQDEWESVMDGYPKFFKVRGDNIFSESRSSSELNTDKLFESAKQRDPFAFEFFYELGCLYCSDGIPQWKDSKTTVDWLKRIADTWEALVGDKERSRLGFEDLSGEDLRLWVFNCLKGDLLVRRIYKKVFWGAADDYRWYIQKSPLPVGTYTISIFSKRDRKQINAFFRQTEDGVLLLNGSDFSEHVWSEITQEMKDERRKIRDHCLKNGKITEEVLLRTMRVATSVAFGANVNIWKYVKDESGEIIEKWRDAKVQAFIEERYPNILRQCSNPRILLLPTTRRDLERLEKEVARIRREKRKEWGDLGPNVQQRLEASQISIDKLEVSVRAYNCLKRANINTIGDILELGTMEKIRSIRNLGKGTVREIVAKLHENGYFLFDNGEKITDQKE